MADKMFVETVMVLPDGRMDTANAAKYLGYAPKTMAMMRSAGEGPPFVKLGRIFYYKDDVDTWIEERRVSSTAQWKSQVSPVEARS